MSASEPSRRGLWLAIAGLSIVPVLGIVVVVSMSDDESKRHARQPASPTLTESSRRENPPSEAPSPRTELAASAGVPGPPPSPSPTAVPERDPPTPSNEVNEKLAESRRVENTDPARARQLLREILELDPDNVVALERLSTKLLIDEKHGEAKELAERCQSLGKVPGCDQIASLAVRDSADVQTLASAARKCLTQTPDNLGCLSGMVNYHLIKGQVSDAAIYSGRLEQQSPQSFWAIAARGRLAATAGRYGEARQLFDAACSQGDQEACFRRNVLQSEGW